MILGTIAAASLTLFTLLCRWGTPRLSPPPAPSSIAPSRLLHYAPENPNSIVKPLQESSPLPNSIMAYKFVDPAPFMPRGCHRQLVGFRKSMPRVVLGGPCRNNNDVAITSIEPLPNQQVSFQSIRELLDDFMRNRRRVAFHSIQPCPYGQTYVRFHFVHDKDFLISGSPHEYGNYRISFTEHNRGKNNKIITMNCEVWIMLLGYNIDYWTKADIEKIVSEWQIDSLGERS